MEADTNGGKAETFSMFHNDGDMGALKSTTQTVHKLGHLL